MNHYTVLLALMVLNIVASAETFAAIPAAAPRSMTNSRRSIAAPEARMVIVASLTCAQKRGRLKVG